MKRKKLRGGKDQGRGGKPDKTAEIRNVYQILKFEGFCAHPLTDMDKIS